MITTTIRLLVAAAAVASGAALAQPARERSPIEPQPRLLLQIDQLKAEDGPTAEALIEPLRALALRYQETDDHTLAVVALQEARQIMRMHRGLFSASVDEAQLLRQQIRSEKALGNGGRAWNLQQDLLTIARQHLDDIRMLPIFRELIDDRTELLEEFRTTRFEDLPPGIYVPCTSGAAAPPRYGDKRGQRTVATDARLCPFGSYRMVVERLSGEILTHYAEAIDVIVKNGDYASQELRDLEKQTLRLVPFNSISSCSGETLTQVLASEPVGSRWDPVCFRAGVGGWGSLVRLAVYELRSGAPAAARANAFAELADWYVRAEHVDPRRNFNRSDEVALALYERALAELGQGDDARESMAQIFSPEIPVTLPTYAPNPLAPTASSRYIDVAFAITRYGKAEHIEISARSENATRADERDLIRLIEFASFRPRAVDGELAASVPVVVRYYLSDNTASSTVSAR
jgi:hypothetical protein